MTQAESLEQTLDNFRIEIDATAHRIEMLKKKFSGTDTATIDFDRAMKTLIDMNFRLNKLENLVLPQENKPDACQKPREEHEEHEEPTPEQCLDDIRKISERGLCYSRKAYPHIVEAAKFIHDTLPQDWRGAESALRKIREIVKRSNDACRNDNVTREPYEMFGFKCAIENRLDTLKRILMSQMDF